MTKDNLEQLYADIFGPVPTGGIKWNIKPSPMRESTKEDWDDLCKNILFRETIPLLGDEQKEI